MKTHTIKIPKAELLVVELQTEVINSSYHIHKTRKGILLKDDTGEKFVSNRYTLLGKPNEVKEEDARELVRKMPFSFSDRYLDYKPYIYSPNHFKTAKESLITLLESKIYWKNPYDKSGMTFANEYENKWQEAEKKTFDRNRSLIFKKN